VKWRLGLDTYTLHRALTAKDEKLRMNLWWVLENLDKYGLSGAQIDPSHFPGDDDQTLKRLDKLVETKGYWFEFGMWRHHPVELEQRCRMTARFGGKAVRTFFCDQTTSVKEREKALAEGVDPMRKAGDIAARHNTLIAIENHGDYTGPELATFLDKVNHPRVGACLDTGNSLFRKEDPVECARVLAPYSYSMHLKDWDMTFDADGRSRWTERIFGQGQVPIKQVLRIVADAKPDVYVALETPVWDSGDESETVAREWRHFQNCTRAAKRLLTDLQLL
jgi:sugar phosphate isomerase/epimerase